MLRKAVATMLGHATAVGATDAQSSAPL